MSETKAPAALLHRPEARSFSVEDLVRKVLDGQLRVPNFQRPLKWDIKDVLALLDSVYRGYPVGTLLLWQRPASAELLKYGSIEVDAAARSDALLVVDGQQRVRALTQSLAGMGHPSEAFAAFFDLQREAFVQLLKRDRPEPHHVPMTEVLDSEKLITWVIDRHLPESDRRAVIQLGKRIREYQIPAYLVATDDETAVQEIFRRANDTGRRMELHEVFNAIHGKSEGPAPANVRDVAGALAELQFGGPDEATLLQMFAAIRGVDATKERVPQLGDEAHARMVELQRSAEATISFLRRDAKIPHASLLPYQQPLLALARLFDRFPEPRPRSRELLARWLWRGALTGAHTGVIVRVREMIAAIQDDETAAVNALLAMLPPRPVQPVDVADPFNWNAARSKVQALALLDLGPCDLTNGARVIEPDALVSASDAHETGWQRLVRKILDRPHTGLANHMIHPATRRGLVHAITTCDDKAWLMSHGITDDARRALKFDRTDDFLRLRAEALQDIMDRFTERRAEWDEIDAPDIETLIAAEGA
ncbi:DUF262 domain-containing protein [Nannocystis radixulma]|uniref:DUF262 domain-containing protein n=1 Tax=Nannocystis radixulma TaxID=2995305 RepID=A0ABT5BAS4_9BACT|nr:DUF262 domain-containing protein [Nannocystis radixulma]MDC0670735.1 DUF262 domain-containing protein [Nannocystis radixulma]